MRLKVTPIVLLVMAICLISVTREASPSPRNSLVINEVSPLAPDGGHSWIEFFNPTTENVSLPGLIFRTDEHESFTVPTEIESPPSGRVRTPPLGPSEFLLVRFGPGPSGVRIDAGPPRTIVITVASTVSQVWRPARGELLISRPGASASDPSALIDYVAWGRQGLEWSRSPQRLVSWKKPWFVSLAEGFGVRDPSAVLGAGASIGLYPGSITNAPGNWVVYDADEASPGRKNRVPRPKAFTLSDGAEVGGQSFAVAWARRNGDGWYRFEMARDADFDEVVVDEKVENALIRVGEVLEKGAYFYRVTAYSARPGMRPEPSNPSRTMRTYVYPTPCSWPLPPSPSPREALDGWVANPSCHEDLEDCQIISSIRFKFQRKDTPFACCACETDDEEHDPCDAPHSYCMRVALLQGKPSYILCAGRGFSPLCGTWPSNSAYLLQTNNLNMVLVPAERISFLGQESVIAEKRCSHGWHHCVRASVSMIVSAYGGACLSQDHIARMHFNKLNLENDDPIEDLSRDLGHRLPVNCEVEEGEVNDGAECSWIMKWALDITRGEDVGNEDVYLFTTIVPSFKKIRSWIDAGRPIMTQTCKHDSDEPDCPESNGRHMRVLAGYCRDPEPSTPSRYREWVFIFDPRSGPRIESYESWARSSDKTWVAPPSSNWHLDPNNHVQGDKSHHWRDSDGDGYVDFDDIFRHPPLPSCCKK